MAEVKAATEKQREFLRKLLAEREGHSQAEELRVELNEKARGGLTRADASWTITRLLAIRPHRREEPSARPHQAPCSGDVHGPGDDECKGSRCVQPMSRTAYSLQARGTHCGRHGVELEAGSCWECTAEYDEAARDREETRRVAAYKLQRDLGLAR